MATSIVIGPSSRELAISVANKLKAEKIYVQHKKFPDGESYTRLESKIKKGSDVIIIETLFPQNDSIVELLCILDVVHEFKPKSVTLVAPYFAYSRQHERYLKWEAVSGKTVAELLDKKINRIFIFDVHHKKNLFSFFRHAKPTELSAAKQIADYFKAVENPFIIAPDQERTGFTDVVAEELGCKYSWLSKHRDRYTGKSISHMRHKIDIRGKNIIIVDDIISTGGTIISAIELLQQHGAADIYAVATHHMNVAGVAEKILAAGAKEVVATNSIPAEISKIDLSGIIADALRKK